MTTSTNTKQTYDTARKAQQELLAKLKVANADLKVLSDRKKVSGSTEDKQAYRGRKDEQLQILVDLKAANAVLAATRGQLKEGQPEKPARQQKASSESSEKKAAREQAKAAKEAKLKAEKEAKAAVREARKLERQVKEQEKNQVKETKKLEVDSALLEKARLAGENATEEQIELRGYRFPYLKQGDYELSKTFMNALTGIKHTTDTDEEDVAEITAAEVDEFSDIIDLI